MKIKIITAAYALFLVGVIILADGSAGPHLFAPLRAVPFGDKLGHLLLMGLFSLLVNLCLACRRVGAGGLRVLLGSLVVALVVLAEELSQLFVRHRSFDAVDLLSDGLGILLAGRLACLLNRRNATLPAS